ncbi:MAG: chemotaxis response regulator protein-glutamate methylesterase [Verrucomicrobiales bacterium]|nr:chemotaxis response regulator protein-glutamate methylesterase [Verrucomicrobiales bacterium]
MSRIRTLIVDDSALVRKILVDHLSRDPEIEVVGTAIDPYVARDKILALDPDVITLDIEMPRMDGLTFLKLIMKHRPMPVVIMSSLTSSGSAQAMEALQAGAVDVVGKPSGSFSVADAGEMIAKIKAAAFSRYRRRPGVPSAPVVSLPRAEAVPAPSAAAASRAVAPPGPRVIKPVPTGSGCRFQARSLIVMGASTGGTEALKSVLSRLPGNMPGICVVQHIPSYFSAAFAERLNQCCRMEVREAQRGDELRPGLVLVAPGGQHMLLRWNGSLYIVDLNAGPPVHHQRPAVDVLFDSASKSGGGSSTLAILLTGMGADGAAGMLRLREAGAETIAQDEQSSVVFGMPREAIRMGAAREVLSLDQMPQRMERFAERVTARPLAVAAV